MKELLLDSITKIKSYIKTFILKTEKSIRFEGSKNEVIKVMLDSVLEEKRRERMLLLSELSNVKAEREKFNIQINNIKTEVSHYKIKIKSFKAFQFFLLDRK